MSVNWTKEQKAVIESRNRNLLVSAAAGSGKTAVLVERIIRMITEGEEPLRIDQLLVMTFTKAAADEMRERILGAVDELLSKHPDNAHLQMQAAMIPYAQITTIDSFCLGLIKDHYNKLDIDPAFTVGDEGELLLMRQDVMKEMLEDYYEEGDENFLRFVETYATGKSDRGIEDYIMQVYTFSQSNPWPVEWIASCQKELSDCEEGHVMETPWMKFLMKDAKLQLEELAVQAEAAMEVCEEENGPEAYLPMVTKDFRMLKALCKAEDYKALSEGLSNASFDRLAAVRKKDIDQEKKAYVSAVRERIKKAVLKLKELYSFESQEEALSDILKTGEAVTVLLKLAEEYGRRYQERKRDKNVVDFNDLEHYALSILLTEEDGRRAPSGAADELSRQYEEILVDEYQDSNDVQEALITSISRERFDAPNVFMVGDVKQSIYQFRLARPQLFLEKYENYSEEAGKYQKIELHQNFRSREEVLKSINEVFYRIMTKNLGNIQYTKNTALHPGAVFKECGQRAGEKAELLMINAEGNLLKQLDQDAADFTSREMEAKAIAGKIKELSDPDTGLMIWDKKLGEGGDYRRAGYGDMVILLRSLSGWAEDFVNILINEGIPACAERKTGYFTAIEVETMLSVLAVIDNPIQDIPLAAVLKSPVIGVTDEELAHMTAVFKKRSKKGQDRGIYGAWSGYLNKYDEKEEAGYPDLYEKLCYLERFLHKYQKRAAYLPIHELLYEIYEETGYYDYVSAMPAGEVRRANLDMLVEKAAAYEETSYTGLFHFIRYIESLKKYDTDFGEASLAGDENTIRVMSIHKSKGLEFPIVFLAGMGKKFNKQDAYGKILIDPDLGIGTDYLDLERRLKAPTLKKNVLRRKSELSAMGEELRVLYVAMTRAKEKLVMTGLDRYLDKKLERFHDIPCANGQIPFTLLSTADSYLDWLLMSLSGRLSETEILMERGQDTGNLVVKELSVSGLVGREIERQAGKALTKENLLSLDTEKIYDEKFAADLKAAFEYQYPYSADIGLHTKLSVSELKKQGQFVDEEESAFLPTIPAFLREEGQDKAGGARRGTACHRALELLDFGRVRTNKELKEAIEGFRLEKRMDGESISLLSEKQLLGFLNSPLGKRMGRAQAEGRLKKEQQFVIGILAKDMDLGDSEERILIQGIMDAWMEEEDGLVLVDYKTDHVKKGEEHVLKERYQIQMDYYKQALEQMTGKKVKEKIIFSLALSEEILLN